MRAFWMIAFSASVAFANPGAEVSVPARLTADVAYLSEDDRDGRVAGTDGHAETVAYIAERFAQLGLTPGFADGFAQDFSDDSSVATHNVIAVMPGSSTETILIAAHFDHLGTSEDGEVFNGADDNASGVAALLELARTSSPTTRTLVFAAFDGEERGLVGSTYYLTHPAPTHGKIATMLNLDSIGRLRDRRLLCMGVGTGDIFADMLDGMSRVFDLDLAISEPVHPAGDHLPFFRAGIPVLHLFSDGHEDYHRVSDTFEKVNIEGLTQVTEFAGEIVRYLGDASVQVRFVPAGSEKVEEKEKPRARRTVSFGTIPDFARETGGVLVSGVLPGSAADAAGLVVGDVIVDIDGIAIDNIYDYQGVLAERKPGDAIHVVVVRGGERIETDATLRKRR